MLWKLQRKTLNGGQLFGYLLGFGIGLSLLLLIFNINRDILPLIESETDVMSNHQAVISKEITVFKSMNKEKIYFTDKEIQHLKKQDFVKSIHPFRFASFQIKASTQGNAPRFYSDLFFESIPDQYLDVKAKSWNWKKGQKFIPIIVPESYLKLYNFGFAESQGLPVLSKGTISQVQFSINLYGNGLRESYDAKIAGFSNKINSILVPDDFLSWANDRYGDNSPRSSRLLVEFNNPNDEAILKYFRKKNYNINQDKLEFGKIAYFFKSFSSIIMIIAVIILTLSIYFVIISINLIFHKNKMILIYLHNLGYDKNKIALFYQIIIIGLTLISSILFTLIIEYGRDLYLNTLNQFFKYKDYPSSIWWIGIIIGLTLSLFYYIKFKMSLNRVINEQ